jgi:hypothetical protein
MVPPEGIEQIRLLMTPEEVKTSLKKAGLQFRKVDYAIAGIAYPSFHVSQPRKGIQQLNFYFREDKLYWIRIEYDMRYFPSFDFPSYLAELKSKYREPAKVRDLMKGVPPPLATIEAYDYRWMDVETELTVVYSPAGGKDPLFGHSAPGDLIWEIADKRLVKKLDEESATLPFNIKKKELEEKRKKLLEERAKKQLEEQQKQPQ